MKNILAATAALVLTLAAGGALAGVSDASYPGAQPYPHSAVPAATPNTAQAPYGEGSQWAYAYPATSNTGAVWYDVHSYYDGVE